MWRRTYLVLVLVRLFFAMSPSYLHPDENFQGPEVMAGRVFSYPVHLTWEFTSAAPVRSALPLWLAYGLPMHVLRLLWGGQAVVPPRIVYWALRAVMFVLSFVLEDWAVLELVSSPGPRRVAVLLVASSYVTWTLQTHTFSNALETLILAWSLVLVGRIVGDRRNPGTIASAALAFLVVLGTFNRVSFPAYMLIPGLRLIPHFQRKPASFVIVIVMGLFATAITIALDTAFYTPDMTFTTLFRRPVITPLNSLRYNSETSNLARHGLHPRYNHLLINLPQLLGPALPLLLFRPPRRTWHLAAALTGIAALSAIPHQELRFLLPAVPLILASVRLPRQRTRRRLWIGSWVVFNAALALLMGVYHQGGVVPAQLHLGGAHSPLAANATADVFWWKTYSPPVWLLDGRAATVRTRDLMGAPGPHVIEALMNATRCPVARPTAGAGADDEPGEVLLVAPRSAAFLDAYLGLSSAQPFELEELWSYPHHLNLDDLDFAEDGVGGTLRRVVGRRGLVIRRVRRYCGVTEEEGEAT